MQIHDIFALQSALPPLFDASAWTRKSGSVAILRPPARNLFAQPADWSVRFVEKRYAALGQAIGLSPTRSAIERQCVDPRHLALLAPFVETSCAGLLDAFLAKHNLTPALAPPPSPAVDYNDLTNSFVFVAHPDYFPWTDNTGWRHPSTVECFPRTMDALRVAALARQMTPMAHAAAIAQGVNPALLEAFAAEPTGRPFLTVRPTRDGFRLYGPATLSEFATAAGFEPINLQGAWETDNVASAAALIELADPLLRKALTHITSPDRLVTLDEIALSDLFELIENLTKGTGPGKAEKTGEREARMSYARVGAQWRTNDAAKAKAAGFTLAAGGYWMTKDVRAAGQLRDLADIDAEIAIQNMLADDYAAKIALLPDPPDPNPPDGIVYDPAQLEAIRFAIKNIRSLNADPMGMGKTPVGVAVVDVLRPRRVLVLTLAGAVESWRRHFHMFMRSPPPITIANTATIPVDGITILSNTSLVGATAILSAEWDFVINDEAHKFKNADSQRTAALYDKISGIKTDRSLDLTGTPIPNKPQDLYNILHNCLPEIFPNRDLFHRLFGLERVQDDSPEKAALRRHLGRLIRRTIMIRRPKVMDVVKTRSTHVINVTDPDIKLRLAQELAAWNRYEESRSFTERGRLLAEMGRMRRETARLKIPEVVERVQLCKVFGDPFLIFGHHTALIDELAASLEAAGVNTLVMHGKAVPPAKRQQAVDVFQNGQYDGVVGGIKSIGTALTITRARRVFVFELDWDPWDMVQAEDRAWRRGQLYDVHVEYIVVEGSLDAYLAYVNNEKIRIATEILDPPCLAIAA